MCATFKDEIEAKICLMAKGVRGMRVVFEPAMGERIKPVVMCDFEADAERILSMGFDARMINEYAVD